MNYHSLTAGNDSPALQSSRTSLSRGNLPTIPQWQLRLLVTGFCGTKQGNLGRMQSTKCACVVSLRQASLSRGVRSLLSLIALLVFIGGVNAYSLLFHTQWVEFKYHSLGFSAALSPNRPHKYARTHIHTSAHTGSQGKLRRWRTH